MKENIILDISYRFTVDVSKMCIRLKERKEYHFAGQLLRSATSIGANVREASAAQTRRDFIAKMSIASKEAREANYWLKIINDSNLINFEIVDAVKESEEIIKIITAILKTARMK